MTEKEIETRLANGESAISISLDKWKKLKITDDHNLNRASCALCHQHNCDTCPLALSGNLCDIKNNGPYTRTFNGWRTKDTEMFEEGRKAMVNLLESLMPKINTVQMRFSAPDWGDEKVMERATIKDTMVLFQAECKEWLIYNEISQHSFPEAVVEIGGLRREKWRLKNKKLHVSKIVL